MEGEGEGRVNCFGCAHFYITWERNFPRGCRALSFKGRELPSVTVFASSGIECQRFEPREKHDGEGAKDGGGA